MLISSLSLLYESIFRKKVRTFLLHSYLFVTIANIISVRLEKEGAFDYNKHVTSKEIILTLEYRIVRTFYILKDKNAERGDSVC